MSGLLRRITASVLRTLTTPAPLRLPAVRDYPRRIAG